MSDSQVRQYIDAPVAQPLTLFQKILNLLFGFIFTLPYIIFAKLRGGEGLAIRTRFIKWGITYAFRSRNYRMLYELILRPLDSTRYFEFQIADTWLKDLDLKSSIDISSPRFFLLSLTNTNPEIELLAVNPDKEDLEKTKEMFATFVGDESKYSFSDKLLDQLVDDGTSANFVSSMSVMEHIPDKQSFEKLWQLVNPGGYLFVTLPCATAGWDQYINQYDYGVLDAENYGYTFWQHFFDADDLQDRVLQYCGEPVKTCYWGEKVKGTFYRNTCVKRSISNYPYWKEPYYIARDYQRFSSLDELPGEGVVAMLFKKPSQ